MDITLSTDAVELQWPGLSADLERDLADRGSPAGKCLSFSLSYSVDASVAAPPLSARREQVVEWIGRAAVWKVTAAAGRRRAHAKPGSRLPIGEPVPRAIVSAMLAQRSSHVQEAARAARAKLGVTSDDIGGGRRIGVPFEGSAVEGVGAAVPGGSFSDCPPAISYTEFMRRLSTVRDAGEKEAFT